MDTEIWKPYLPSNGMYEVSTNGRVRSVDRMVRNRWREIPRKGVMLKPCINPCGYHIVNIKCNGKPITKPIHRLVAETFLEQKSGCQVNHVDGNKLNNNASNLEWITHAENVRHAVKSGLLNTEKRADAVLKRSKLDFAKAEEIRRLFLDGKRVTHIAKMYGVSQPHVTNIVKNLVWVKRDF